MRRFLLLVTTLLWGVASHDAAALEIYTNDSISTHYTIAQSATSDTVYIPQKALELLGDTPTIYVTQMDKRLLDNKFFQMTYIGVPLVVAGVATQYYVADRFKDLRDAYVPTFHHSYDDYLQYAPGVALLAMKAAGVQSRSSWGRLAVSGAFSVALTFGVVNGLKYSVKTMRPDGSRRNSFPSGHTATAFAAAHMLHKEYGNLSPWISVGGYTVASVVGVSRQLNNRHWISDVLAGAGIGILSVEFGYFFADLIFKDKGLYEMDRPDFSVPEKPSNLGLTMGLVLPLNTIDLGNGRQLISTTGSRMGVEGAWYINKYVGIGAEAAVANLPTVLDSNPELPIHSINTATVAAGAYGRIPIGSRFGASIKGMLGCNILAHKELIPDVLTADGAGFYYELGADISVVARRHFGVKLFCDYGGQIINTTHRPSEVYNLSRQGLYTHLLHTATIGLTTSILF